MLCLGFRKGGRGNFETKISGGEVECRFPSWIINYLKSPIWETLLSVIGDINMFKILWDLPMIVFRHKKTLFQLTGQPISGLLSQSNQQRELDRRKRKRLRYLKFKRYSFVPIEKNKFGFPHSHPFNVLAKPTSCVSRTQARKLALIITKNSFIQKKISRLSRPWIEVIPKLQQLLENHRKCPYKKLFLQARHKFDNRHPDNSVNLLESLKDFEISIQVVSYYIKAVLLRILPSTFWGSRQTKRLILSKIIEPICIRNNRTTPYCLSVYLKILNSNSFVWLKKFSFSIQKESLKEWLEFLIQDVIEELILTTFHVLTDEEGTSTYFLRREFKLFIEPELLERFEKVEDPPKFPYWRNKVSFIKKKQSKKFRMIMNLSSKSKDVPISTNQELRPAYYALKYEVTANTELSGSFVQDLDEIHAKYHCFIECRKKFPNKIYYGVAVDIKQCFDTMRHDILFDCVKSCLKNEEYAVSTRSHSFIDLGMRKIRVKRLKLTKPSELDEYAIPINQYNQNKSCVVSDGMIRQYVTHEKVLQLVERLLSHTYVEKGKSLYRLKDGIPQGSIVSTLLCRLYYGKFENEEFPKSGLYINSEEDLLMRLVDDFLFITPSQEKADRFFDFLSRGNEKYNCFINKEKTHRVLGSAWIPWCGLLFHLEKGWVRLNFNQKDNYLSERFFLSGPQLKLRNTIAVKCHPILFDLSFNSVTNALINLAQILLFCARRFENYLKLKNSRIMIESKREKKILVDPILKLCSFTFALLQSKLVGQEKSLFTLNTVICLGMLSFYEKFRTSSFDIEALRTAFELRYPKRIRAFESKKINWKKLEVSLQRLKKLV